MRLCHYPVRTKIVFFMQLEFLLSQIHKVDQISVTGSINTFVRHFIKQQSVVNYVGGRLWNK